jgi:hypothetical protein
MEGFIATIIMCIIFIPIIIANLCFKDELWYTDDEE